MENRHFLILIWCIIFSGCVVVETVFFNCTFDEGFCDCEKVNNRYNKLTWGRQKSPTTATGPDSDHTSGDGFYIYINSSNELANKRARLFIPWKPPGNYCLSFWYYMYGRHTDILRIALRDNQTKLATKSRITNITRKEWILQKVKLTTSKNFRIAIDGIIKTDKDDFGYIAVDDVKLFREECPTHCSDLTPVLDKAVVRDILKGSIVHIKTTCKEGSEIKGNSFIVCQNSGKWSDTPSCQPIECSKPILTKGLLEPNGTTWYYNQFITLACADGSTLRGSAKITCKDSGNWTTLPTCDYTEESGQSASIAVVVTVSLLAIGIIVVSIVVVFRKTKRSCMKGDKTNETDMNRQTQHTNKTYINYGLNTDSSKADETLGQDTEYAIISKDNLRPEMKDVVHYNTNKYRADIRNNVDYDHMKTSFESALDNTYSHIQDNNNDLKTKPSKNSTDSYSYTNAAFQESDDEYNHIILDRTTESGNKNIAINSYREQESDYDHAQAGGCDSINIGHDEYSHLDTAGNGQDDRKEKVFTFTSERRDKEQETEYEEPTDDSPEYFNVEKEDQYILEEDRHYFILEKGEKGEEYTNTDQQHDYFILEKT